MHRIWAMSVWWTQKIQTWLQAIYKWLFCSVSGCINTRWFWLVNFSHSYSYWMRRGIAIVIAGDTISDMTPMIQESNWYLVIGKFGNQPLDTFKVDTDRELASIRNINWSLLNVTKIFRNWDDGDAVTTCESFLLNCKFKLSTTF